MLNSGLAAVATNATVGRYLVLLAAVVSVAWHAGFMRLDKLPFFSAVLGAFFFFHSFVVSPLPDVSILKAVNWTAAIVTLLVAWAGLDVEARNRLQNWLFCFLVVIALVSLPLFLFPSIGYLRNGTGFQGILSHPQAFGPAMALLGALSFGRLLSQSRPSWWLVTLSFGCLLLVLASEARTAGVALVISLLVSVVLISVLSGRKVRDVAPALRSKRLAAVGLLVLTAVTILGPRMSDVVNDYITKSGRAQVGGLIEAYDVSRGGLIDEMTDNIERNVLTGIGFGIASEPSSMFVSRDPIFGLPVGASIEKGVMPIAVMEEVGVPGFILVAIWIWVLLRRAAHNGMAPLIVALTALLINMGEAILFSSGGMGMLLLILLAFSASKPRSTYRSTVQRMQAATNV
jgi:hypothetical protein